MNIISKKINSIQVLFLLIFLHLFLFISGLSAEILILKDGRIINDSIVSRKDGMIFFGEHEPVEEGQVNRIYYDDRYNYVTVHKKPEAPGGAEEEMSGILIEKSDSYIIMIIAGNIRVLNREFYFMPGEVHPQEKKVEHHVHRHYLALRAYLPLGSYYDTLQPSMGVTFLPFEIIPGLYIGFVNDLIFQSRTVHGTLMGISADYRFRLWEPAYIPTFRPSVSPALTLMTNSSGSVFHSLGTVVKVSCLWEFMMKNSEISAGMYYSRLFQYGSDMDTIGFEAAYLFR